jgi:membrane-associated protease RseP (regulator of RpoE activity)
MRVSLGFALACQLILATTVTAADIKPEQIAAFKPGVATYEDVTKALGPPMSTSVSSNGNKTIAYSSTHAHATAVTYVPIVGLFAGGAKGTSSSTVFVFGPDGRLVQASSTSANIDCSVNLLSTGCNGGHATQPAADVAPASASASASASPTTDSSPRLGAGFVDLSSTTATMLGRPDLKAAVIMQVTLNSVADRGGLRAGDTVTDFDGHAITGSGDLTAAVHFAKTGAQVAVSVIRAGQPTMLTLQF